MRTTFLLFLPFICFIAGYAVVRSLLRSPQQTVPELSGLLLPQALTRLSQEQLHGFILNQRDDPDMAPTTVVDQIPPAGTLLKTGQSIGLTITQYPAAVAAPCIAGTTLTGIAPFLNAGFRVKPHPLPIAAKIGYCCAQYPPPGTLVPQQTIIDAYCASGLIAERIIPSLRGKQVAQVDSFLSSQGIPTMLFHTSATPAQDHTCDTCIVIDQKPLPGTIFNLQSPPTIQLLIATNPLNQ